MSDRVQSKTVLSFQRGVLLISLLLAILPLFTPGMFTSHDGELHLGRIPAFARELAALQFPVRWSESLNHEYGTPIFSFMYPLPYVLTTVPYWVTHSAIFSLKFVLAASVIAAGFAIYAFVKTWSKDTWAATVAAIVYTWMPYRLLNVYTRVALGEVVAFIFPPLVLWGAHLLHERKRLPGAALTWIGVTGLILAHNAMSLMFVGPLFLWYFAAHFKVWPQKEDLRTLLIYLSAWFLGLLSSAFFWLPALLEKKYTLIDSQLVAKDFSAYFLSVSDLLQMPWTSHPEFTPAFFGVAGVVIALAAVISLGKYRSRENIFLLLILYVSLFMTLPMSRTLWENLPLLPYFQLPWRFMGLAVWATALLIPGALRSIPSGKFAFSGLIVFFLLLQGYGALTLLTPAPYDDANFERYPGTTTWHEEGTPLWTAGAAAAHPEQPFEISDKEAVQTLQSNSTYKAFTVSSTDSETFVLNQVYFPGWKSYINGVEQAIEFQDPTARGLMKIQLPAGENTVEFRFTRTKVRAMADAISIFSLLGLGMLLLLSRYWQKDV